MVICSHITPWVQNFVSWGILFWNCSKYIDFWGIIGNFSSFSILSYRSIWNTIKTLPFQIYFKNIDFWESYVIFRFYRFTRAWTRIYKTRIEYLLEKGCNSWSKVAKALPFCHFGPYMMQLKTCHQVEISSILSDEYFSPTNFCQKFWLDVFHVFAVFWTKTNKDAIDLS